MEPSQDVIDLYETASQWLTRRKGAAWSPDEEQAFQAWLTADPSHATAYQEVSVTWQRFDHIPRPVLASDAQRAARRGTTSKPAPSAHAGARPSLLAWLFGSSRRWAPALLSACLVVGIGGWYAYDNTAQYTTTIRTAHAQVRNLSLPDGSKIAVNMDSTLSVAFYPRRREVQLARGEAFFEVAPKDGEPFTVQTGNTDIRVVGTAFNVRTAPPELYVKVAHGTVQVRTRESGREQLALLHAGDAIAVDQATGVQQRIPSAPDVAGAWRHGQLIFRDTALSEAADELSRYLNAPVRLASPAVGRLRLSGFASTADPQAFLDSLPQLLAVSVQRLPDGSYRIAGH